MIRMKKIVFPTDFSEYSAHALPYALEFARQFGAAIHAVHVITTPTYAASYEIAIDMTTLRDTLEESARARMVELEAKLRESGVAFTTEIRFGMPFLEVLESARDQAADLIILATHGWGPLKHMLLGSTAERIVRKARCPVLTVRHPEHEFVVPGA